MRGPCDHCDAPNHAPYEDGLVECIYRLRNQRDDARDEVDDAYRLGCIVGAAIVAWGDAMRKREEAKQRAKDWEDRKLEADMG